MSEFKDLCEKMMGIQVMEPKQTIKDLKKHGVKAQLSKKFDDEIEIDLKDKDKVKEWMLTAGWEEEDIKDIYPRLMESDSANAALNSAFVGIKMVESHLAAAVRNADDPKFAASLKKGFKLLDKLEEHLAKSYYDHKGEWVPMKF
jgi:hypothetical protein